MENKSFFSRWKQGMQSMTPMQILNVKKIGFIGGIFGYLLAIGFLIYYGYWYLTIAIIFAVVIQAAELISVNQQMKQLEKLTAQMIDINEMFNEEKNENKI